MPRARMSGAGDADERGPATRPPRQGGYTQLREGVEAAAESADRELSGLGSGPKIRDTNINDIPYPYSGSFSAVSKPNFAIYLVS